MAQSGYTPIILFNSGTTGHVPTTGNLTLGELAINYTDGKIFYNNGAGAVVQYNPPAITLAATSGTINGVVIGGTTPAAATFSTLFNYFWIRNNFIICFTTTNRINSTKYSCWIIFNDWFWR